MYQELKKYATGEKIKGTGVLLDKKEVNIYYYEYSAGLGDLIEDFIRHNKKPSWKRKYYHNHLTKIYKDMLNYISVSHRI